MAELLDHDPFQRYSACASEIRRQFRSKAKQANIFAHSLRRLLTTHSDKWETGWPFGVAGDVVNPRAGRVISVGSAEQQDGPAPDPMGQRSAPPRG